MKANRCTVISQVWQDKTSESEDHFREHSNWFQDVHQTIKSIRDKSSNGVGT